MDRVTALIAAVFTLTLTTWLAVAATQSSPHFADTAQDRQSDSERALHPRVNNALKFQGARSCSASACHGNTVPDVRPGVMASNEYHVWFEFDPHAKAHQALTSDLGKEILRRLGAHYGDAQYQNCLACHSPSRWHAPEAADVLSDAGPFQATQDGVSCEACHGPAQRWRTRHYRADWTSSQAEADGMVVTKGNLVARARICAECHVGSQDREVNHDMIAAGHPMLRFEMTAYSDMLPRHWRPQPDELSQSTVWAAGQIAAADAALELLAARAAHDSPQPVWPEFSEYACFRCHHDLNVGTWRSGRPYNDDNLAAPKWGEWYFAVLRQAAQRDAQPLASALEALQTSLQGYSADPQIVAQNAAAARSQLYYWATTDGTLQALGDHDRMVQIIELVAGQGREGAIESWDVAMQVYLALVALDVSQPEHRAHVRALLDQVNFAEGYDSPKGFTDAVTPGGGDATARDRFRQHLEQILKQLSQQQGN